MDKWERLRCNLIRDIETNKRLMEFHPNLLKRWIFKGRYEQAKLILTAMKGIEVL